MAVRSFLPGVLLLSLSLPLLATSPKPAATRTVPKGDAAIIARGKYLVERAAPCADCHSPRNQHGEYVQDKWLQGAPILFKPTVPMPEWAHFAPPIAGLKGWKETEAIKFLMTGVDGQGQTRRPPMPPFRFNRADATAIVKYLKSLHSATSVSAK